MRIKSLVCVVTALTVAGLLTGCDLWNGVLGLTPVTVKITLLNSGSTKALATMGQQQSGSFTPESVKIPIVSYELESDPSKATHSSANLWSAADPGNLAANEVDIANQAELDALAAKATGAVGEGTYDLIYVNFASGSDPKATSYIKIKGTWKFGTQTWYTSATGPTTDAAAYDYAQFPLTGTSAQYPFSTASGSLTITKGQEPPIVQLFANVDAQGFASELVFAASDSDPSVLLDSTQSVSLQANPPLMMAYVGTVSPTVETYRLRFNTAAAFTDTDINNPINSSQASMQWVIDPGVSPQRIIGVFLRAFTDGSVGQQTSVGTFGGVLAATENGDGTWKLRGGTVDEVTGLASNNGQYFPAFTRMALDGVDTGPLSADNKTTFYYQATRVTTLVP